VTVPLVSLQPINTMLAIRFDTVPTYAYIVGVLMRSKTTIKTQRIAREKQMPA
jgi:hypothetical protein